jgi:signal transduction histidine kinase
MLDVEQLTAAVVDALAEGRVVPLLVLRLPEFAQGAWREGKIGARRVERTTTAAFRGAARRLLREQDLVAHDRGSDRFVVAMSEPSRAGVHPGVREVRAVLERVATAMSRSTGRAMHTGWSVLEAYARADMVARSIEVALERGYREREQLAMLATVGHELRTPVTSIRGYIETLLDDRPLDAQTHRRFLETARREALRLGRLVDGMLEFSMLDLSLLDEPASCDAVEQINAAVDAVMPIARRRSIIVEAVDLPVSAMVRVDADACTHALLNLLENAIKYGREGGRVLVACEREARFVRISVDDDGLGIAREDRNSIFRMGVRGSGVRGAGNGIGLAVVNAIAKRSGGDVTLQTSQLGGARFIVRLASNDRADTCTRTDTTS